MEQFDEVTGEPLGDQYERRERKSALGCLLYGCLFVVLAFILLAIALGVGGYLFVKNQVSKYTSETPMAMPVVEVTEAELAEIQGRVESFQEKIEAGVEEEEPEPMTLVLTDDEINALITKDPNLKGRVHVTITEGQVTGEVSIPTDMLPIAKGRYFNATATLDVALEKGVLIVTLADATVKGQPLPQSFVDELRNQNLAKDNYKDPEVAKLLSQFDRLEVGDGQITLTATPKRKEEIEAASDDDFVVEDFSGEEESTEEPAEATP